jgi:hypothetical protein
MIQANPLQMRKAILPFLLASSFLAGCAEDRAFIPEDKGPSTAFNVDRDYGAGKLPDGF